MSRVPRRATPPVFVLTPSLSEASVARTVEIGEVGVRASTALRISAYVGVDGAGAGGTGGGGAATGVVGGTAAANAGEGVPGGAAGGAGHEDRFAASQRLKSSIWSG